MAVLFQSRWNHWWLLPEVRLINSHMSLPAVSVSICQWCSIAAIVHLFRFPEVLNYIHDVSSSEDVYKSSDIFKDPSTCVKVLVLAAFLFEHILFVVQSTGQIQRTQHLAEGFTQCQSHTSGGRNQHCWWENCGSGGEDDSEVEGNTVDQQHYIGAKSVWTQ